MSHRLNRRAFLGASALALSTAAFSSSQPAAEPRRRRILLRSSWQTVNIGDVAHTPGMLTVLERHLPDVDVTLWPSSVGDGVAEMLKARFPKLTIASTAAERERALDECDFCLHGSGPGLVGRSVMRRWKETGKPYGFGGVTLSDAEIRNDRELMAGAKFVFCRDTDSLQALKASGIEGPAMEFGPDATFALDVRNDESAVKILERFSLPDDGFLCAVPRLRYTPYWEIHRERKYDPAERARKEAVNEQHRDADHARLREALTLWVRETGKPVLLCPEMTYEVERLSPLLRDDLPDDVQPQVHDLGRYWSVAEAASVYARARAVVSFEMHSPIIAVANETPAIHLRQPTDTRKGQMWRDVGLSDWIFEIDETTGKAIGERLLELDRETDKTEERLAQARTIVAQRFERLGEVIGEAMG